MENVIGDIRFESVEIKLTREEVIEQLQSVADMFEIQYDACPLCVYEAIRFLKEDEEAIRLLKGEEE